MTKLSSSWCTAFELYHIVRSSYTVHQRPQNEMWSLLDMFTLMFVESFALFIIKTNKPTKTNNECYSKNKSMFCLILTEGRLFSLVSLLDGYNETRKVYRCSRTDAQFKEVKKLVVVGEGWKWLLECLTKNDLAKKHNNSQCGRSAFLCWLYPSSMQLPVPKHLTHLYHLKLHVWQHKLPTQASSKYLQFVSKSIQFSAVFCLLLVLFLRLPGIATDCIAQGMYYIPPAV